MASRSRLGAFGFGEKLCEPMILLRLQPCAFQHGVGSNHQNAAQIAVALFGDRPELLCHSACNFGSDAISMMFTAAQVAPINLA